MDINDNVLLNENGVDYVATVLEIRELEHLMGKNEEPVLHLGFFQPVFKADATGKMVRAKVVGTHEQFGLVQFRLDVVHESHEFGEAAKAAGFTKPYQGARWRYASITDVADKPAPEESETEDDLPSPVLSDKVKTDPDGTEIN